jgi:transcriptional regulator GlxA family with amidase domain
MLTIVAAAALAEVAEPDIVLVPGGPGSRRAVDDDGLVSWIRHAHERTTWTTSVCTGSLLLGAAGVLDGIEATTHWGALELLARYGAVPVSRRVVRVGKVVTAAGVSAGIDMALTLAGMVAGDQVAQAIQLGIEYDPQPPFTSGSVDTAPPDVLAFMRDRAAALNASTGDGGYGRG